jgi:hypothetical protein
MRRSFRTRVSFSGRIPRVCTLGWYAMPRWGMGSKHGGGIGFIGAAPTRWNAMPRWGMGSKTWWWNWLQRSRADTLERDARWGMGSKTWWRNWLHRSRADTLERDARWGMDAGSKCHCSICPNGATHTRQGIALGTANCPEGGNAYQPRVPTLVLTHILIKSGEFLEL